MSGEDTSGNATAEKTPAARVNRLSIAHLLLWLTMTSVVLACEQRVGQTFPFADDANWEPYLDPESVKTLAQWKLTRMINLITVPVSGAALAASVLALTRLLRRRPGFPTQSGHWLFLIIAVQFLTSLADSSTQDLTRWPPWDIVTSVPYLVPATVAAAAALKLPTWRWRATFILLAVGYTGFAIGRGAVYSLRNIAVFHGIALFVVIPEIVLGVACLCALVSSAFDLRSKNRHDIYHWAGVCALFAVTAELLAMWFIWQ